MVRCVSGAKNIQNFHIINNEVTKDLTELYWQKSSINELTWSEALNYCESLSLSGHSDWRLPNIRELVSLVSIDYYNFRSQYSSFIGLNEFYFPNSNIELWSSTQDAASDSAWMFDLESVQTRQQNTYDKLFSKCVRGGKINFQIPENHKNINSTVQIGDRMAKDKCSRW